MSKSILYIGNNLEKHTGYATAMGTLSNCLKREGYTVYLSSDKKSKLLRLLDMCFSLLKHHHKVDYVIIDTFSTYSFYFSFITSQLCRILRKKYIPFLHGGNLPYRLKKSPLLSKMIFDNSYKNVAPSNYLKTAFEERDFPTGYIPNILDIENYTFKKRERLSPKILWVRAFKHLYNPMMAIEVLLEVKKEFPNASLCMIGPEKDDSYNLVKTRIENENLESSVQLTGVMKPKDWHKKSEEFDIFINTTNFDNTPVSVMEAMALGLSIVSTNVGGLPFLIEDGKDGFLVEKNNPDSMAETIIKLIENPPINIIMNAKIKAESFAWSNIKPMWINLLK